MEFTGESAREYKLTNHPAEIISDRYGHKGIYMYRPTRIISTEETEPTNKKLTVEIIAGISYKTGWIIYCPGYYGIKVHEYSIVGYVKRDGVGFEAKVERDNMKLTIDTVHYLAMTYDNKVLRLYLDGQLVASEEKSSSGNIKEIDQEIIIGGTGGSFVDKNIYYVHIATGSMGMLTDGDISDPNHFCSTWGKLIIAKSWHIFLFVGLLLHPLDW